MKFPLFNADLFDVLSGLKTTRIIFLLYWTDPAYLFSLPMNNLPIEVLHGSHVGWQVFPMGTNVLSNANNFHCPAIQYGCRAKPL